MSEIPPSSPTPEQGPSSPLPQVNPEPAPPQREKITDQIPKDPKGFLIWVRNKLITGVFFVLPLVLTYYVLKMIYTFVGSFCDPFVRALVEAYNEYIPSWLTTEVVINGQAKETIPFAGLVITLLLLLVLGVFASHYLGKKIVSLIDTFLLKVPVINTIYHLAKQIVDAFQGLSKPGGFEGKQVVYVKYPDLEGYLIGFLTGRFTNAEGKRMAAVFVPTAPNPITGFVLVFHESQVLVSDLGMDEAWRLLVSAGLVHPMRVKFPVRPITTMPPEEVPVPSGKLQTE